MEILTNKQRRFCEEYLIDLDATAAYKRAGYKVNSDESARTASSRLLTNVTVLRYLKELMDERSDRTAIKADKVLEEISGIAFAKITDFLSIDDGEIVCKSTKEWAANLAGSVAEISRSRYGISVKMGDKLGALKLLYDHLGLGLEFNRSVQSLRKYGLELYRDDCGYWQVKDLSRVANTDESFS